MNVPWSLVKMKESAQTLSMGSPVSVLQDFLGKHAKLVSYILSDNSVNSYQIRGKYSLNNISTNVIIQNYSFVHKLNDPVNLVSIDN